jgi:hypothetical protein
MEEVFLPPSRLGDQELAVRLNTGGFALCSTLRGTYGGYVEAIPPKAQGRGGPIKEPPPPPGGIGILKSSSWTRRDMMKPSKSHPHPRGGSESLKVPVGPGGT